MTVIEQCHTSSRTAANAVAVIIASSALAGAFAFASENLTDSGEITVKVITETVAGSLLFGALPGLVAGLLVAIPAFFITRRMANDPSWRGLLYVAFAFGGIALGLIATTLTIAVLFSQASFF